MNKILIVGGGNFPSEKLLDFYKKDANIVIAVDRGYDFLSDKNIHVNYLIGDFDSINSEVRNKKELKIIEYPSEKDATDLELAFDKAIELGADNVVVLGGTGTRLDHTMINIILLKKLFDAKIEGKIVDDNNFIEILKGTKEFYKNRYKYISIIPLEKTISVTLSGMKYPLDSKKVPVGSSLCISNEIKNDRGKISVSDYAIIIQSKD